MVFLVFLKNDNKWRILYSTGEHYKSKWACLAEFRLVGWISRTNELIQTAGWGLDSNPHGVTCFKPFSGSYQLWTLHWNDIICALLWLRDNKSSIFNFFPFSKVSLDKNGKERKNDCTILKPYFKLFHWCIIYVLNSSFVHNLVPFQNKSAWLLILDFQVSIT